MNIVTPITDQDIIAILCGVLNELYESQDNKELVEKINSAICEKLVDEYRTPPGLNIVVGDSSYSFEGVFKSIFDYRDMLWRLRRTNAGIDIDYSEEDTEEDTED